MPNGWHGRIVVFLMICFLCSVGRATVRRVPGDYSAIQSAIDSCSNGDVILVSPGVYNENINFRGKAITLSSTNPADLNVVTNTIIHAVGQTSVVTFATSETSNSIFTGFTITGGYGTLNSTTNFYYRNRTYYYGAGIFCYRASPTIIGNIIRANSAPLETLQKVGVGGGIACIECSALITRNLIAANSAGMGGGIYVDRGQVKAVSNLILGNYGEYGGGAVLINGGHLVNNSVLGNGGVAAGNVFAKSSTNGQCVVTGNIISEATSAGGIKVETQDTITQIAFNDVWNNSGGNYLGNDRTGVNGNISQNPQFIDVTDGDYHLLDTSPCVNTGNPNYQNTASESDFYGSPRIYSGRVDIGAAEWFVVSLPFAEAGPDQLIRVTRLPTTFILDGSGSYDPAGGVLSYHWRQTSGPSGNFTNTYVARPAFNALGLGAYRFELVVSNSTVGSLPDFAMVTVTNEAPTADAGDKQMYYDLAGTTSIVLNGSRSFDPEQMPLSYRWRQVGGWKVTLSNTNAANPTFVPRWLGTYLFELLVNDGLQDSLPDVVTIVIGPNHAPVADAGLARYVGRASITLDGTRSYDPDGYGTLSYQWKQVSGPVVTMAGTNTATPVVGDFTPTSVTQQCVFELIVNDGNLSSAPNTVAVTVVPDSDAYSVHLKNPPFNPARPTMIGFNVNYSGIWLEQANWIDVMESADKLMVYLSSVAPDYRQPIQTIGSSIGAMSAMNVAFDVNSTYQDPRYAVNRVTLLDATVGLSSQSAVPFNANPIGGEQCWVDSYSSGDPNYSTVPTFAAALNVLFQPNITHGQPSSRYASSWTGYQNGGLVAFAYLSVIGDGRNYQVNTSLPSNKYYFKVILNGSTTFYDQTQYPGKILAPVILTGPTNDATLGAGGAVLTCQPVENAAGYKVLVGADPDRVMDFSVVSDTPTPPTATILTLPLERTWWTVKAYDQFGSTIYADPRLIKQPENRPPVANAGSNQTLYVGPNGKALVTLSGSGSTDADGDALSFVWAWAVGTNNYSSNGVSPTIELPAGVHTIQLMANDGHVDSQPTEVLVTVWPPGEPLPSLTCSFVPNVFTVAWPTNPTNFVLISADSLASNAAWSPVIASTVITNGEIRISLPPTNEFRFFRLRKMVR